MQHPTTMNEERVREDQSCECCLRFTSDRCMVEVLLDEREQRINQPEAAKEK